MNEWGVFTGGGTGVAKRSGTQFFHVGVRWGRVLTEEHGKGWIRGRYGVATEIVPLHLVLQPGGTVYGGEFRPMNMRWHFKGTPKMKPWFELGGGLLVTRRDVPPNTNNVNFTPQGGMGFHFLRGENRAITLTARYMHVSNAGLSGKNSGINSSFQFSLGYTWFR